MNIVLTTSVRSFRPEHRVSDAWNLKASEARSPQVTIAVIGSEQDILSASSLIKNSQGQSNYPLMDLKIMSKPQKSWGEKLKVYGELALKVTLGVAAGFAGAALGGLLGVAAVSVAPALGVVGLVAGTAVSAVAISKGKLGAMCLGLAVLGGTLAATGAPLAGLVTGLGIGGLAFQGLHAGAAVAREVLKPEATLEKFRNLQQ